MAVIRERWRVYGPFVAVVWSLLLASVFVSAERRLKKDLLSYYRNAISNNDSDSGFVQESVWEADMWSYRHIWPEMKLSGQLIVGSIVGFLGAAFGSVGGVGGGGIFVPMLTLLIGFDPKSATAISKCMIMGGAASTVYYNLKLRHPTLDMPIIDYDLAVLIQPMLMLGISIGVTFNVVFADWMVTLLLIILFVGTSTKAFFKGVETWRKETIVKMEAMKELEADGSCRYEGYKVLPGCLCKDTEREALEVEEPEVSVVDNVWWKEFGLLAFVWVSFLVLQIIKNYTTTCSAMYWLVNFLQIPVSFSVSGFEAISLYHGRRMIASKGRAGSNMEIHQLMTYCLFGILAGVVGGLLGLGGGFIMGPLFLELGVPPQVSSATSTFAMLFSSSMSVVEYHLLNRFPVHYALYFAGVATVAALVGQHVVRKVIIVMGRASIIIFILASTIFVSAISLGGVGISNMFGKIQRHEYMGFENLCGV